MKRALLTCTAAALLFAAAPAAAQSSLGGYALDQLDPPPAGDDFFGVRSADTQGHLELRAVLMFDYAADPLVIGGEDGASIVASQAFARADVSLSLFDRLLLSLDMPVAVVQSGDSPTVAGVTLQSPDGAEVGDLRLDVRSRLLGQPRGPIELAIGTSLYLPTAGDDSYAGDGGVRGQPHLTAGGRVGDGELAFLYTATGGVMIRTADNPSNVTYGAGVAVALLDDMVQVGPEIFGSTALGAEPPLTSDAITVATPGTALEMLGGVKLRVLGGLVLGAAGGGGLTQGVGIPAARVIGLVGWAPRATGDDDSESDRDRDGIPKARDACPDVRGEANEDPDKNGCPAPDRDRDGVADTIDACPGTAGRRNADATRNGCPADYDRDGVPDTDDSCPNQAGIASTELDRNGCPGEADGDGDGIADRVDACPQQKGGRNEDLSRNGCPILDGDSDGILDADDACPSERGAPNADAKLHGCPANVRVTTGEIVILKQVLFRFGQANLGSTIDPVSDDLLTEVRDVIQQHPEIEVIEVQGHADDVGTAQVNKEISERRAEAVRGWLVQKGIDPKRLASHGYGSAVPIAPNTTEAGRQKNRRVQFVIKKAR